MRNNIVTRKISIKLLFIITLSFFLAIIACSLFSKYIIYNYILSRTESLSAAQYNIFASILFIVGMVVFILFFLFFIRNEIRYIKYIANEVKRFAGENFDLVLEIRGNDELAELCININSMSKKLKNTINKERAAEKTKNELITNVSHDLRTPLTAMIGYLDILKNDKVNNREKEMDYLKSAYNLSIKLKKLIDELFEYTKLAGGEIKLELIKVDICSILNQVIGEYLPILESKNLSVISHIPDTPILVKIDIEKMVRVFHNILSNAEKYSYKPSIIEINVEQNDKTLLISFSNRCKYISQDELDRMFERFYRADISRSSNIQGSGLGLAISKEIVRLHTGDIWAEANKDTITFKIKLQAI